MQQTAAVGSGGQLPELGGRIPSALLSMAFCYLVLVGGTGYSSAIFGLHIVARLLTFLVFGAWLVVKIRRGESLPRTGLDVSIAAMLLVLAFSAIFSREPRLSLDRVTLLGSFALAYYLVVDLRRRGWCEARFLKALLTAGVVAVVLGLAEVAGWYFGLTPFLGHSVPWPSLADKYGLLPPVGFRLFATMWNPNVLAAYLVLTIPLLVASTLQGKRPPERVAAAVLLGSAGVVAFFTSSRGGWLGIAVGLMCMAILMILPRYVHAHSLRREVSAGAWPTSLSHDGLSRKMVLAGLGTLTIFAGLLAVLMWWPGRTGAVSFRFEMWHVALQSGLAHPLWGEGPGTFPLALLPHLSAVNGLSDLMPHAHNALLNLFDEAGLGAVFAGIAIVAVVGWKGITYYRGCRSDRERMWAAAALAALAGLGVHNMVDDLTSLPAIMVPAIVIVAMITGPHERVEARNKRRARPILAVVFALGIAVAGFAGYEAYARYFYEEGVSAGRAGDWRQAAAGFDRAAVLDPALSIYQFQVGVAYAWLAAQSRTDQEANYSDFLSRAIAAMETGIQREPDCALNVANLAALHWTAGNRESATREMERAVVLEPKNPLFWYRLGSYHEESGNRGGAMAAYSRAVQLDPDLFEPPGWRASAFRRQNEQAILDTALRESGGRAGDVYAGYVMATSAETALRPAEATKAAALGGLSPDNKARLAVKLGEAGEAGEASALLKISLAEAPHSPVTIAAEGEMMALRGDWQEAERYANLAAFIDDGPESRRLLGKIRLSEGSKPRAAAALRAALPPWPYEWAESYGSLVYGVNAPGIDVTPQLVGEDRLLALAGRYTAYSCFLWESGLEEQARTVDAEVARMVPFGDGSVHSGCAAVVSEDR